MTASRRESGTYQASQAHRQQIPWRYSQAGGMGVIALAGHNSTADTFPGPVYAIQATRYLDALAESGYPSASCALDGNFGNSAMRTRITNLRTYMQSASAGTWQWASGKVHLLGASAGGIAALAWAKANPTLVQSIALIISPPDIQAMHTADRGGLAADLATAYGGAPADSENPADFAADLNGIPIKCWYSTNDSLVLASEVTAFATAAGAITVSLGAQGHSDNGIDVNEVVSFIDQS